MPAIDFLLQVSSREFVIASKKGMSNIIRDVGYIGKVVYETVRVCWNRLLPPRIWSPSVLLIAFVHR